MNNVLNTTVLSNDLFKEEIKQSLIFHIPHSSLTIPDLRGFNKDLIEKELEYSTDYAIDIIFNVENTTRIITPYSRIFCDVERLLDCNESMFKVGRGFYYTKTFDGKELREKNEKFKKEIYIDYYCKHHEELNNISQDKLNATGFCTIIDCHSFNNEYNKYTDICIGTDNNHTPQFLINILEKIIEKNNLAYKLNSPYSGTIIPNKYFNNPNVYSIMIEINKRLYIDNNGVNSDKVSWLNQLIRDVFE